jgi:hypothetical protein
MLECIMFPCACCCCCFGCYVLSRLLLLLDPPRRCAMLDAAVDVASGSSVATDGTGFCITVKWQQQQQQLQQQAWTHVAHNLNPNLRQPGRPM